jgi:hypothetical protein
MNEELVNICEGLMKECGEFQDRMLDNWKNLSDEDKEKVGILIKKTQEIKEFSKKSLDEYRKKCETQFSE